MGYMSTFGNLWQGATLVSTLGLRENEVGSNSLLVRFDNSCVFFIYLVLIAFLIYDLKTKWAGQVNINCEPVLLSYLKETSLNL